MAEAVVSLAGVGDEILRGERVELEQFVVVGQVSELSGNTERLARLQSGGFEMVI